MDNSEIRIGQLVKVNYDKQGEWVSGKVVRLNHSTKTPTFNVLFVDGEIGTGIQKEDILPLIKTGNEDNFVIPVFIPLPQKKIVKYLPGLAARKIPPRSQTLYHVPTSRPGREHSAETFFATRQEARKAWKNTLPTKPVSLLNAKLVVAKQPRSVWFAKDVYDENDPSTFLSIKLHLRSSYDEVMNGSLRLKVILAYESLVRVDDQSILSVITNNTMDLVSRLHELRFRIEEPSTWARHRDRRFVLVISTDTSLRGERVRSVTTTPFSVLTKNVDAIKRELADRKLYASESPFVGDGYRFRYLGKDCLTSKVAVAMTPYAQRKIVLQKALLSAKRREMPKTTTATASTVRRRHMTGAERLSFFRRAAASRSKKSRAASRKNAKSSRRGRRRRREGGGRGTPIIGIVDEKSNKEDSKKAETERRASAANEFEGKTIACPALDIVRSLRSIFPPTEDVLEEARERERKRIEAPPNEWKKDNRIFQMPFEIEVGKFYATHRRHFESRFFFRKALALLENVFGREHWRVAPTMERLSASNLELGCLERAMSLSLEAVTIWRRADYDEESQEICYAVQTRHKALVRSRRFGVAIEELREHKTRLTNAHRRAIETGDTSATVRALEALNVANRELALVSRLFEMHSMRKHDDRTSYEESCRMRESDARMSPEQQQQMSTLKILRDAEGFELLERFATRSEGHFRMRFWREVQQFKKYKPETREFAEKMRSIFEKYIVPRAMLPVLTNELRQDIHDALNIDSEVKITRHIYDKAEAMIVTNLANETIPEFYATDEGRAFIDGRNLSIPLMGDTLRRAKRKDAAKMLRKTFHATKIMMPHGPNAVAALTAPDGVRSTNIRTSLGSPSSSSSSGTEEEDSDEYTTGSEEEEEEYEMSHS